MEEPFLDTFLEIPVPVPDHVLLVPDRTTCDPFSKKDAIMINLVGLRSLRPPIRGDVGFTSFQYTSCRSVSYTTAITSLQSQNNILTFSCRDRTLHKPMDGRDTHEFLPELTDPPLPATRDKTLVKKCLHYIVGTEAGKHPTETVGSMSPTPSSCEVDRLVSGSARTVHIKSEDIDHLSSGGGVVYTQDSQDSFGRQWDNWIVEGISSSDDNIPPQLQAGSPPPPYMDTPENSIVRHQKQPPCSDESGEEYRDSLLQQEDAEHNTIMDNEAQNVDAQCNILHRVVHVSRTLYLYLINPPFIALPSTLDDIFHGENLDFHLSFLQTWILGTDICLLGAAWAFSVSTTASQNPITRIFLRLSASFAFFGIVFALLLRYNIGIMKKKGSFAQWVNNEVNRRSENQVSVWNPIIMLNLPLAWTGWAVVNMILLVLLYTWSSDPCSSLTVAKSIPEAFTSFVISWSVLYVVMIRLELSRCCRPVMDVPQTSS